MPNKVPRLYWDCNLFVSYIEETPGRAGIIEQIMSDAEQGKVEIFTSTVTIAEVAFHEREKTDGVLDPEIERRISALWDPPSPVKLAEFHRLIGEEARGLIRSAAARQWGLKGMDAIHLATAQHLKVERLHTYDGKMHRYAQMIGCAIEVPSVLQSDLFTVEVEAAAQRLLQAGESHGER